MSRRRERNRQRAWHPGPTLLEVMKFLAATGDDPFEAIKGSAVTFHRPSGQTYVDRIGPDEGEPEALKKVTGD